MIGMRNIKYIAFGCLLVLLFAACEKELEGNYNLKQMQFGARIEPLGADGNTKVYLDNERWVYWEVGDRISIASDQPASLTYGDLVNASPGTDFEDFNGIFLANMPEGSQYFLGLHPYSEDNVISGTSGSDFGTPQICLRDTQPFRNDLTFAKQVYPMVAWYGGTWGEDPSSAFNLDFHALAGIVRLQIFNNSGTNKTLKQVTISSNDATKKQLKGLFNVKDYKIEDPYLQSAANTTENQSLLLYCGEDGRSFNQNELLTFYLVLPALGGRGVTTEYKLTMAVTTMDNATFTKNFTVPLRRTGLTNMKAMGINAWGASDGSVGLAGNGTQSRPFKVYTIGDLQYLRDCYNGVARTINGQPITPNTYITLMRSDIVLDKTNWTVGIRNFEGHLNSVAATGTPGIIDSCYNVPLFESIGADGEVEGIALKCATVFNTSSAIGVSPFCGTNDGTIRNCVLTTIPGDSKWTRSIFSPFAGICVTNTGTIEGCRCEGRVEVQTSKNFAGICLHNQSGGEIVGCQASSMTLTVMAQAAGICYENAAGGTVRDSYFAADITGSTADWAGIVYENSGTVEHCYLSSSGHIYTSKSVGGIVRANIAGTVDYCWLAGPLRGRTVGGIVDSLVGGQVINSFNSDNAMITVTTATSVGGGLVGYMKGGSIDNSYVDDIMMMKQNESATIGGIIGQATGGSCDNCYSYEDYHLFYGTSSGVTYTHCHLVDGSQSGPVTVNSSATDAFVTLQGNLNTNKPSGGKGWIGASGNTTPPALEAYIVTPTKRRR